MYYEVHRSAPKVLTRQMAGRYLAENVRIPKYMDIIANGAFQKRNVIQSVQFPSTLSRRSLRSHGMSLRLTAN